MRTVQSIESELLRQIHHFSKLNLVSESNEHGMTLIEENLSKVQRLAELDIKESDIDSGSISFCLVLTRQVTTIENLVNSIVVNGKSAVEKMYPKKPNDFVSIGSLDLPNQSSYILVDVDRGARYLNVVPELAFADIYASHRSPLTIEEGLCLLIQFPLYLKRNNCFSMLGSRIQQDKRVPAVWLNSKNEANLGWCWNGNPHTWLGSASCRFRI